MSCFGELVLVQLERLHPLSLWPNWSQSPLSIVIYILSREAHRSIPSGAKFLPNICCPCFPHVEDTGVAWLDRTLRVYFKDKSYTWRLAERFGSTPSYAPIRLLEHPHDMAAGFSGGDGLRERRRRKTGSHIVLAGLVPNAFAASFTPLSPSPHWFLQK